MSEQNAVENQTEQVNPAPVVQPVTELVAKPDVTEPTISAVVEANKRQFDAFAKLRIAKKELEAKLAAATATPPPPPAVVVEPPAQHIQYPQAPAAQAVSDIEEKKALEALVNDKQVAASGCALDIVMMVDNDPKLSKIHAIDPNLAYTMAKTEYLNKSAVSAPPPMPMPNTSSGQMGASGKNLEGMLSEIEKLTPGTREWSMLAKQINEEHLKVTS